MTDGRVSMPRRKTITATCGPSWTATNSSSPDANEVSDAARKGLLAKALIRNEQESSGGSPEADSSRAG